MTTTVRSLVEQARIRHWSFTDLELGDGPAVLWINQRERTLLMRYRDQLEGLIGQTQQVAAVVDGGLVGVTEDGTPYYITTTGTGYAVHATSSGTPYIDTDDVPVIIDPFGEDGDVPGWALPVDAISILALTAVKQDGSTRPVIVLPEKNRFARQGSGALTAFVSANRIVPILPDLTTSSSNARGVWTDVTGVQLSYVGSTSVAALSDPLTIPAPLHEALIAGLAELFSTQSRAVSVAEKRAFTDAARIAAEEIGMHSFNILGTLPTRSVTYIAH